MAIPPNDKETEKYFENASKLKDIAFLMNDKGHRIEDQKRFPEAVHGLVSVQEKYLKKEREMMDERSGKDHLKKDKKKSKKKRSSPYEFQITY